jgi:hypothetical protein
MPTKKTPKKRTKSDFIRGLPSSTPAVDVIAKGKAAGLKLTKNYVYKVRTEINAKSSAKPVATAVSSKKTTQSKSDFIRQQPATLSAAEVVAKAKAAGVTILLGLVYEVRRTAKAKKGTVKKTTTAKPTAAPSKSPGTVSKADFVRARAHLSPKEIVEDAKAAGLSFDDKYVYNIRGYDKSKTKTKTVTKQAARRAVTSRTGAPVSRPITTTSSAENLLKALGAELGLGRAIEILAGERARVRSILRGA